MARIGKLFLDFEAGTAKFNAPLKKAGQNLRTFGRTATATRGRMASLDAGIKKSISAIKGLFAITAVIAAFRSFSNAITQAVTRIDSLAKTSRKLGLLASDMRSLQVAGELTGVTISKINLGLQRMTRRVAEAAVGMGEARGALVELGLDANELNTLPLAEKFEQLANAFEKVENPADRVRLAMKLFDSEGVDLVNTLDLGSDKLREITEELRAYGVLLSKQDTKRVEELNDAWTSVKLAMEGLVNDVLILIAPILEGIFVKLRDDIVLLRTFISIADDLAVAIIENVVGRALDLLAKALERINGLFTVLQGTAQVFAGVTLGVFSKVLQGVDSIIDQALERINELITSINENVFLTPGFDIPLVEVFDDAREQTVKAVQKISDELNGAGAEKIREGLSKMLNPEGIDSVEVVRTLISDFKDFLTAGSEESGVFRNVGDAVDEVGDSIDEATEKNKDFARSLTDGMARGIVLGERLGDVLANVAEQLAIRELGGFLGNIFGLNSESSKEGESGGFLGKIFGGAFANGGPVSGGVPILVGERGKELFVPHTNGSIVPNHRLPVGGGGAIAVTNYFDIRGSDDEVQRQISRSVEASVAIAIAQRSNLKNRGFIS